MIKKIVLSCLIGFGLSNVAMAKPALTGCEAKRYQIETQLEHARKYNNKHEIRGLEKALRENAQHCTNERLRQEREKKVDNKLHKLDKRQRDLNEAQATGDPRKIKKNEKKLHDAQKKLNKAKSALTQ